MTSVCLGMFHNKELFKLGERADLTRILSRITGSHEPSVPFWTGLNSVVLNDTHAKGNIGYLPIINAWTVIQRCLHISDT